MNRHEKRKAGKQTSAHIMVVQTAKEMAGAIYEELAKRDEWYKLNPSQAEFINRTHGSLIEQARGVLAGMLANPAVAEATKEQIADALIKDRSLMVGRGSRNEVLH